MSLVSGLMRYSSDFPVRTREIVDVENPVFCARLARVTFMLINDISRYVVQIYEICAQYYNILRANSCIFLNLHSYYLDIYKFYHLYLRKRLCIAVVNVVEVITLKQIIEKCQSAELWLLVAAIPI